MSDFFHQGVVSAGGSPVAATASNRVWHAFADGEQATVLVTCRRRQRHTTTSFHTVSSDNAFAINVSFLGQHFLKKRAGGGEVLRTCSSLAGLVEWLPKMEEVDFFFQKNI